MASYQDRKGKDGKKARTAHVRIAPFEPTHKTFRETDFPSWREAQKAAGQWAEETEKMLREQRGRGGVRKNVGRLTTRELVDAYLADPETRGLLSYDSYEHQLAWWADKYGSVRALEFSTPLIILEAREALLKLHGAGTVNRYLSAARSAINWARGRGLPPTNTVWPPRMMLTEPKARERFLTDEELGGLLKAARADSSLMFAAVMFAIGVGCRQGEQLRVRWGDIDTDGGTVAIRVSKTDTSRRAHLPSAVISALELLRGDLGMMPARFVFANEDGTAIKDYVLIDKWQKLRKVAKLPELRWHDLRHACELPDQNGSTLAQVAGRLGHKAWPRRSDTRIWCRGESPPEQTS